MPFGCELATAFTKSFHEILHYNPLAYKLPVIIFDSKKRGLSSPVSWSTSLRVARRCSINSIIQLRAHIAPNPREKCRWWNISFTSTRTQVHKQSKTSKRFEIPWYLPHRHLDRTYSTSTPSRGQASGEAGLETFKTKNNISTYESCTYVRRMIEELEA